MSTLITLVLNNADKIPIVGAPINQATTWYRQRNNSYQHPQDSDLESPPPPYEKEPIQSRLTQISDYVWKRTSFSANNNSITPTEPLVSKENLNKKQIDEGISLIQMATEMNNIHTNGKNKEISIGLYMMGLDKILTSLPVNTDPLLKSSLEKKLSEFKKRTGLLLIDDEEANSSKKQLSEKEKNEALGGLSNLVIQAAVLGAVALKKSPLPDIMSRCLQMTKYSIIKIDQVCSIRERTINIAHYGIARAIEIDQHYEVHQFFAEVFYTTFTAVLKAGIAYSEYDNDIKKENNQEHQNGLQPESSAVTA
ncbi:MAG: hypothetical protein EXX96DRAFT_538076 [Benjaminiella poitrasii]|nr:MAG: hypothetical protein EXX96DRAFT_538076 [Benjaminiella poitrasii]